MSGPNGEKYAVLLDPLEPWQHLTVIAGTAQRLFPAFARLSSPVEQEIYLAAVTALWGMRELAEREIREHYQNLSTVWPTEQTDQCTPYPWKRRLLAPLTLGLDKARTRNPRKGSEEAAAAGVDIVERFERELVHGGIPFPLADAQYPDAAYSRREWWNFVRSCELLASTPSPEQAVQRAQELSEREAESLADELLPLWIEACGWSDHELTAAHGSGQHRHWART